MTQIPSAERIRFHIHYRRGCYFQEGCFRLEARSKWLVIHAPGIFWAFQQDREMDISYEHAGAGRSQYQLDF